MNISIVIAAYNESENIKHTMQELSAVTKELAGIGRTEIIVIDDHSSDSTYDCLAALKDPAVRCMRLSRRSGSHTALRVGIKESINEAVLCISADGQDDPSSLGAMLEKLQKGSNVVWALRKSRKNESWYKRQTARAFYRILFWLARVEYKDIDYSRAGFFLLDRNAVNALNSCPERNTSLFGLISWIGFNQDFVEYEQRSRRAGKSKWNFSSRLQLAKDWIVAFSGFPIFVMSTIGILLTIVGSGYTIYLVLKVFCGARLTGWSVLLAVISVICGIQMTMMGILGEYIWRGLDESRKRPLCFIEKRSDLQKGEH